MNETLTLTRRSLLAGADGILFAGPLEAAGELPKITVTKDPSCGCCTGWVAPEGGGLPGAPD